MTTSTPIRALYADFPNFPFHLSYSAYKRRTGRELLIHPEDVVVPMAAREALPALV